MASINPTSVSVVRPYAGAVNARANAKSTPAETEPAPLNRKIKLSRPEVASAAAAPAAVKPEINPLNDGPLKTEGVAPAKADDSAIIEPVNTDGISDRTDAVLEHTLGILMDQGGITDPEALTSVLSGILEPLVAQDGVANSKAATMQYIKEYIAEMQADSNNDAVGLKSSGFGKSGAIDLEG